MSLQDGINTNSTTIEKILSPFHRLFNWISGDPDSPTFQTRRTLFEVFLGIIGFIAVKKITDNYL